MSNWGALVSSSDYPVLEEVADLLIPIMDGYYGDALERVVLDIIDAVRSHDRDTTPPTTPSRIAEALSTYPSAICVDLGGYGEGGWHDGVGDLDYDDLALHIANELSSSDAPS